MERYGVSSVDKNEERLPRRADRVRANSKDTEFVNPLRGNEIKHQRAPGPAPYRNLATYIGSVNTLKDAVLLIEAVRIGRLPTIARRLNGYEREYITPNLIYVWNETECGLKRWTDGKIWSASKALGPFLVYLELSNKNDTEPKPNGLIKQSFSLNTKQNHKYHLIAYTLKLNFRSAPPTQLATPRPQDSVDDSSSSSPSFSVPNLKNSPISITSDLTPMPADGLLVQSPSMDPTINRLHLSPLIYQENLLSYIYNGVPTMATLHTINSPPVQRYDNDDQLLIQLLNRQFQGNRIDKQTH